MKNQNKNINRIGLLSILGILALVFLFSSCKEEEIYSGPITIGNIYLQDYNSIVQDRLVTFVRLGQTIRIEGTGFTNLRSIEINGYETYFNPVMSTDVNLVLKVSDDTPIIDADPAVRNTIKFINDGNQTTIEFNIRDAAPTITDISNTLPAAGEEITIYGTGLTEISKITFPGMIEVTEGITSDELGEFCTVIVPSGISMDGGSVFVEGANGGAYSPAYFNCTKNVIMDFDANGVHGYWGDAESMIRPEDLDSVEVGTPNVSKGVYVPHKPDRLATIAAATTRCSEVWTAGNDVDDWRGQITPTIPASTSVEEVAFQFDVFVPTAWQGSGYLKVCLINAFNGGEWAGYSYNWVPWIVNGEVEPYQTDSWTTITIPLSEIYAFSEGDFTFEDVLIARETSSYKNFGFYFENSDFTLNRITGNDVDAEIEFLSSEITSLEVLTDNWRIVSLETPSYSDFPDGE